MIILINIILITITLYFLYSGYKKGFVIQIFQIIGLFVAFFLTTPISRKLTQITLDHFDSDAQMMSLALSIIVYTVLYFAFSFLGKIFGKKAAKSSISLPNKIMGALFGSFKCFFVISIIFVLVRLIPAGDVFLKKNAGFKNTIDDVTLNKALVGREINVKSGTSSKDLEQDPEGFKEDNSSTSNLVYLCYKTSKMLDPFVDDFKVFFYNRKGEALKNLKMPKISMPDFTSDSKNSLENDANKKKANPTEAIDNLLNGTK